MEKTYTITRRNRQIGFGWSTIPTGNGTEIAAPTRPNYEGTVKQVLEERRVDRNLRAIQSGGVFMNAGWFFKGMRIVEVNGYSNRQYSFSDLMGELLSGERDELTITVRENK